MTVYGIGAYYDKDVSSEFITHNFACIGWSYDASPYLHEMMLRFKIGDIVYIKTFTPQLGLTINAVGVVVDSCLAKKVL